MAEKPKRKPQTKGDEENGFKEAVNLLNERLDNLEDYLQERGQEDGKHKVILANAFYKANERGILEVSKISAGSARPLSLSLALGDYLKSDIQSGLTTLPRRRLDYFFRLKLSERGYNRSMSMPVLQEQVSAEAREEDLTASELEAGER